MTTSLQNEISRRAVVTALAAVAGFVGLADPAYALNTAQARRLINSAVGEINAIINSGKAETALYRDFERVFAKYADVPSISRFALGPVARGASSAEMNAFAKAFQSYLARKYGKQFRDFQGTEIEVTEARPVKSFFEVKAIARKRGSSPVAVSFMVSDRSGSDKFFDLLIEGVSLLKAEQTEIGAMLDKRGGSISRLTQDLERAS